MVEPGGIATEFANNVLKQVEETGGMLDDEYLPILQHFVSGAQGRASDGVYQSADDVAAIVMDVIGAEEPPIRIRTSEWAENFTAHKTKADPDGKAGQAMVRRFIMNAAD